MGSYIDNYSINLMCDGTLDIHQCGNDLSDEAANEVTE